MAGNDLQEHASSGVDGVSTTLHEDQDQSQESTSSVELTQESSGQSERSYDQLPEDGQSFISGRQQAVPDGSGSTPTGLFWHHEMHNNSSGDAEAPSAVASYGYGQSATQSNVEVSYGPLVFLKGKWGSATLNIDAIEEGTAITSIELLIESHH